MIDIQAVLLDIEGTTTPIDYVFGVLFPYFLNHLADFLDQHGQDPEVKLDLDLLRQEYLADLESRAQAHPQSNPLPPWQDLPVEYINFLVQSDRKSSGLKSLQGKIWQQGYQKRELCSQIFADLPDFFRVWQTKGKRAYIYSSGSVIAQKLLFEFSEFGDLTNYISGYFDTAIGSKKEANSYTKIAAQIGLLPPQILFISDLVAELEAAQIAGLATLFSSRPGNRSHNPQGFGTVSDFNQIPNLIRQISD
ncbi:MAG: acireductone synthase [Pseudanabaenaceae cyanobacterium bins.68]|nr:acireductone synthase [Pseudanabaenaceae cyanobacterium bins.68]